MHVHRLPRTKHVDFAREFGELYIPSSHVDFGAFVERLSVLRAECVPFFTTRHMNAINRRALLDAVHSYLSALAPLTSFPISGYETCLPSELASQTAPAASPTGPSQSSGSSSPSSSSEHSSSSASSSVSESPPYYLFTEQLAQASSDFPKAAIVPDSASMSIPAQSPGRLRASVRFEWSSLLQPQRTVALHDCSFDGACFMLSVATWLVGYAEYILRIDTVVHLVTEDEQQHDQAAPPSDATGVTLASSNSGPPDSCTSTCTPSSSMSSTCTSASAMSPTSAFSASSTPVASSISSRSSSSSADPSSSSDLEQRRRVAYDCLLRSAGYAQRVLNWLPLLVNPPEVAPEDDGSSSKSTSHSALLPREFSVDFLSAFVECTLAQAQELTVCRAVRLQHTDSLIGQLCVGVADRYESAMVLLRAMCASHSEDSVCARAKKFLSFVNWKLTMYRAAARHHQASDLLRSDKAGEAVACWHDATELITRARKLRREYAELAPPSKHLLALDQPPSLLDRLLLHLSDDPVSPTSSAATTSGGGVLEYWAHAIEQGAARGNHENSYIYYQAVASNPPELPSSRQLVCERPPPDPRASLLWCDAINNCFRMRTASELEHRNSSSSFTSSLSASSRVSPTFFVPVQEDDTAKASDEDGDTCILQ